MDSGPDFNTAVTAFSWLINYNSYRSHTLV